MEAEIYDALVPMIPSLHHLPIEEFNIPLTAETVLRSTATLLVSHALRVLSRADYSRPDENGFRAIAQAGWKERGFREKQPHATQTRQGGICTTPAKHTLSTKPTG